MIYFDNAATSLPKPQKVKSALIKSLKYGNSGRSAHPLSIKAADEIFFARELVSKFLGNVGEENIIFVPGATFGLNMLIRGMVQEGCHYIISDIEHNSVVRPIEAYCNSKKASYSIFSYCGNLIENIKNVIRDNTKCIFISLCSNVTGEMQDLELISNVATKYNLKLIVDAAQLIGHKSIDLNKHPVDALIAPGHKGLLGPQGIGFVYLSPDLTIEPLVYGGNGQNTFSTSMSALPPERYEAGTLPCPNICGLVAGLNKITKIGVDIIEDRLLLLTERLADVLYSNSMKVYGCNMGIASFNYLNIPSSIISEELSKYGIYTRSGFHCSPLIHKRLGTMDNGTVRVSLSYFNTNRQIDRLNKVLKNIKSYL